MKTGILILVALLNVIYGYSQNSEKISVKTIQPIYLSYNSADELLQPKHINNAIELKVKVKENSYNIFAHVTASDINYYSTFNNKLALRLQNHDSYNASVAQEVLLSQTPMLLFTQPGVSRTEHFKFYYDVILYPFNTFIKTGQYNFYITFTMTNP